MDELVGQQHIIGTKQTAAESTGIWGNVLVYLLGTSRSGQDDPIAQIVSHTLKKPFFQLSAINAGVKDIRETIEKAKKTKFMGSGGSAILFIDEIHRFNKSQQDASARVLWNKA